MKNRRMAGLLDRLAESEDRFLTRRFLAPVVRGRQVGVRIEGVVFRMQTLPRRFEGWGVFRPESHSVARLVSEASLLQRREYLDLLPLMRMVLCSRAGSAWLAVPADAGSSIAIVGTPEVRFVENAERFQTVRTRFDGTAFWFDGLESRQDPTLPRWLNERLGESTKPDDLRRSGLTAQHRLAYAVEYQTRTQAAAKQQQGEAETQLRAALAHAGAGFEGFVEHRDGYRVTWRTAGGQRHVSSVNRDDLTVQVAGICLDGEDRKFDLASLVGVVREGERGGEVAEVGQENGGMAESEYWSIHPPR